MKEKFDYPLYDEITEDLDNVTALYMRNSPLDSAKDSNKIEVQYEALKRYCLDNNVQNAVIFIDDNVLGADAKRPAYQAMLKQLKGGKIKKAIFYSAASIGRSPSVVTNFFKDCQKYKFDFYVIKDNFDSKDRKAVNTILSVITDFRKLPKFIY